MWTFLDISIEMPNSVTFTSFKDRGFKSGSIECYINELVNAIYKTELQVAKSSSKPIKKDCFGYF